MKQRVEPSAPTGAAETAAQAQHRLGPIEFTLLVIGAVIGADVYVVAGLGAGLLGPAQLLAWIAAGVLAALIALAFVQCAIICPDAGGSYIYARTAFGPLLGFVTGWALYLGEWIVLPVFPLTFINYLGYFLPQLSSIGRDAIAVALVVGVTAVTIRGMRASGWTNDVFTVAKLLPLAILILAGLAATLHHPSLSFNHSRPFAPFGWGHFGAATVLIFWAFAGFELAVLPAGEVRTPRRTLPRGLIVGMAIVTLFYLLSSWAVVIAIPSTVAAGSSRPLSDALGALFVGFGWPRWLGQICMSLGGLISIASVYEVFMLSLSRLSYALASDGLFPAPLARLHPRFSTPYVGLLFQAIATLVFIPFAGLSSVISIAVFFLGICYLFTALAALQLIHRMPEYRLHLPGLHVLLVLAAMSGLVLISQSSPEQLALGTGLMGLGLLLYALREKTWSEAAAALGELKAVEPETARWMRLHAGWLLATRRHLQRLLHRLR